VNKHPFKNLYYDILNDQLYDGASSKIAWQYLHNSKKYIISLVADDGYRINFCEEDFEKCFLYDTGLTLKLYVEEIES
jgi:hypothetical protein